MLSLCNIVTSGAFDLESQTRWCHVEIGMHNTALQTCALQYVLHPNPHHTRIGAGGAQCCCYVGTIKATSLSGPGKGVTSHEALLDSLWHKPCNLPEKILWEASLPLKGRRRFKPIPWLGQLVGAEGVEISYYATSSILY